MAATYDRDLIGYGANPPDPNGRTARASPSTSS